LALATLCIGLGLLLALTEPAHSQKPADPAKEPAKAPAKEPAKDAPKEPAKDAPKEPAKDAAKEAAKEPAKDARSSKPPSKDDPLATRVARATKVSEQDVNKVINALGAAVQEDLKRGKTVSFPGLGTFRVVSVPAHRDLQQGRPVVVPARNSVEFLAGGELESAANSSTAVPAEAVPPFQYVPLPNQIKGQKDPGTRAPNVRTP
jgi:nucleoid DNA-binding protein